MMKERIARALYDDDDADVPRFGWDHDKGLHGRYLVKADAVLAVLREPTPEMIEAGFGDGGYQCIWTASISRQDRIGIWQAMIDAAISPPEGMGEEKE